MKNIQHYNISTSKTLRAQSARANQLFFGIKYLNYTIIKKSFFVKYFQNFNNEMTKS